MSQPRLAIRILVSTVVGVLLYWLQYIPLPSSGAINWIDNPMTGPIDLVVLPTSFVSILSSFVIVEIVAWAVPRWRSLRQIGVPGRSKLNRATLYFAIGYAAIQAFGLAMFLRSNGEVDAGPPLLWAVSSAAATCVVFVCVQLVKQYGVGNGWSIAVLVLFIDEIWAEVLLSIDQVSNLAVLVGSIGLVLALATVWFLQAGTSKGSRWLPMPTTGLVPLMGPALLVTNFILGIDEMLSTQEERYEFTPRYFLIRVAVVLVFGVLCHRVYFGDAAREHRAEIGRRSLIASLVFLAVIMTAQQLLNVQGIFVSLPMWIILIAIVHDLTRELRFRQKHGDLVSVGQLNRIANLPRAITALDRASVPSTTLGQGLRSMLHFFGPYVPVDIVVPADREEVARESLEAATP